MPDHRSGFSFHLLQLASVKVTIESAVMNKVLESKAPKSVRKGSALKNVKKVSNVDATSLTDVRRSTRKRVLDTPSGSFLNLNLCKIISFVVKFDTYLNTFELYLKLIVEIGT